MLEWEYGEEFQDLLKKIGLDRVLRDNKELGWRRPLRLTTRWRKNNSQHTVYSGKREQTNYSPKVGSRRIRSLVAVRRKRKEGWFQWCPFSYDQACYMHPPSVECYVVQAFSIASDFDPKLMPKEQNQITMRKVCTVIQSLLSLRPNHYSK